MISTSSACPARGPTKSAPTSTACPCTKPRPSMKSADIPLRVFCWGSPTVRRDATRRLSSTSTSRMASAVPLTGIAANMTVASSAGASVSMTRTKGGRGSMAFPRHESGYQTCIAASGIATTPALARPTVERRATSAARIEECEHGQSWALTRVDHGRILTKVCAPTPQKHRDWSSQRRKLTICLPDDGLSGGTSGSSYSTFLRCCMLGACRGPGWTRMRARQGGVFEGGPLGGLP